MKRKNLFFCRWLSYGLFAILFSSQFYQAKAQTPIADASRELRRLFAPVVNPNYNVRFFYDMAAHTTDSVYFTHLNTTDTTDADNWYRIFEEMGYMAYDSNTLIKEDSVDNLARPHIKNDTIPLAIMDLKFNLLKAGVLDTNIWFDFDTVGNTLSDQPGRPSSPYEPIQNIFQCSPLELDYGHTNPVFMINPKFIFADPATGCNTCHKLPYDLKIDFNDGTGFHNFSSDTTSYYRPIYSSVGSKIIQFKLDSSGTMKKYSKALFKITGATVLLSADSEWHVDGATLSFFTGCEGTMQKKFVIYLEGLDVLENRHGGELYEKMIKDEEMTNLQNLGYTFIMVDWKDSYRDIKDNAMSVVAIIDTLKRRYPNLPPLVVVGESMGGLVGRYALRWMETSNYLYDQTHPQLLKMHNTRLFLTIDAPQRGANVPLAYQWFYRYSQVDVMMKAFIQPTVFKKIIKGHAPALNGKAVKQMLLYHINTDPFWLFPYDAWKYSASHDKGDLDRDFVDLGNDGWPQFCKKVALSNGSWLGDRQERAYDFGYREPNDIFLKIATNSWLKILGKKVAGEEWALVMRSNPSGDGDVYESNLSFYTYGLKVKRWSVKPGFTKHVLFGVRKVALDCKPYCVSAGSNQGFNFDVFASNKPSWSFNILGAMGLEYDGGGGGVKVTVKTGCLFGLFGIDLAYEAHSDAVDFGFIPTGSSFAYTDFESQSLDYPLIADSTDILSKTPYDVVITNPTHHTEYTTKNFKNGNRIHLYVENTKNQFNDFSSCDDPPSLTELTSHLLTREIGDDSLYLENTEGMIPFDIEAYNGIFVNHKNPHYNYPGDYAKFSNYTWDINGRNDFGAIVLSKDNPYRVLSSAHTFRSNDSFFVDGLDSWDWVYVPSAMIPCCNDFELFRTTKGMEEPVTKSQITNGFSIYPNPAQNGQLLKVNYGFENEGLSTLVILNMLGQKVVTKEHYCNNKNKICSFEMPLNLQPGMYLLRVENGKEHHDGKFIISQ